MYSAVDVFELMNYHDLELTLDHLDENGKQRALQEAEEPKPQP
jgi:hypothetical protein